MANNKSTPSDDDITLIVPFGTRRTGRVVLPHPTAIWLHDQLIIALGKPEPEPEVEAPKARRLRRGHRRAGR
jgi:hypothetical protein